MRGQTDSAKLDAMIGLIYDCAVAPARIDELLFGFCDLFRAHFADRFSRSHDGSFATGQVVGLDRDDYELGMIGKWSQRNPWGVKAPVTSAGAVRATWQFLEPDELVRSDMFADYLDERGLHEGMRFEIWSDAMGIEDLSLLRPFSTGPFTEVELDLGRSLMPHLQRAAGIRRRLHHAELIADAGLRALATLDHAVVLLDQSSRLLFSNAAAERLFAAKDVISCAGTKLSATTPVATRQLDVLLQAATLSKGGARAGAALLPSRSGQPALVALALPIRWDGHWAQPGLPAAILCVGGAQLPSSEQSFPFASLFGLTTAEAKLATHLLSGQTLAEVAREQQRSLATVKTHLARLMAKTDTTRQSELLRRLSAVPRLPAGINLG